MKKPKPELLRALESLKSVSGTNNTSSIDLAFEDCHTAPDDVRYAHALYREIGEIALRLNRWTTAEEFAVKSLLSVPGYGAALKVMGLALRGQGRLSEAAICHRYGLPRKVRRHYFNSDAYKPVRGEDSRQTDRLPAYPSVTVSLNPPVSVDDDEDHELSHKELRSSDANTYRLTDAQLWFDGFNTVVWDSSRQTIKDLSRGLSDVVNCALASKSPDTLPGKTCLLGNRNSGNYYHWMNDIIPRLQVLKASGIDVNTIGSFIVNPLKHRFQHETLARLGIDEDRLCFSEPQNCWQCEELLVPVYGSNTLGMGQGKWIPDFLSTSFLTDHEPQPDRRLYISRKYATGRVVENESELMEFLTKKGFQIVYLESKSVKEQSRLFDAASVVISSHGAGLSNIAFCQKGTTVIELYRDHMAPCYWITSELTSLRHAVLYCGEPRDNAMTHGSENFHISADKRRHSDFSVNMERLEQLFKKLQIA